MANLHFLHGFLPLLLLFASLEQRLDIAEHLVPLPGAQRTPGSNVALDDKQSSHLLVAPFLVLLLHKPTTNRLQSDHQRCQFLVSKFLHKRQNARFEEHLNSTSSWHATVQRCTCSRRWFTRHGHGGRGGHPLQKLHLPHHPTDFHMSYPIVNMKMFASF